LQQRDQRFFAVETQRRTAMIEKLTGYPDNVLAFVCKGHVSKQDYDKVLVPAVTAALKTHDKMRLYYETAGDFAGIDPGAVWEDFKVGMEHLTRWERMALVTDIDWIKHTVRFFSFMMPGTLRIFSSSEAAQARAWIAAA
jgi:SpoIIAA-like